MLHGQPLESHLCERLTEALLAEVVAKMASLEALRAWLRSCSELKTSVCVRE